MFPLPNFTDPNKNDKSHKTTPRLTPTPSNHTTPTPRLTPTRSNAFEEEKSALNDYIQKQILDQLTGQAKIQDSVFAMQIQSLPAAEQFIFKMDCVAREVHDAEMYLRCANSGKAIEPKSKSQIPVGAYIHSSKSGKYYLNLGVEAKTLQGCIYTGHEYTDEFIAGTRETGDVAPIVNFCKLIELAINPSIAIKYYDKKCCDLGVTLNGLPVKEKAMQEFKMTRHIYRNALQNPKLNKPLLAWLPDPYKNVIKLIEHWEDKQRGCYFMVTEFANCGELLLFIDSYHSIIYRAKKSNIQRIDDIQNDSLRELAICNYRDSILVSGDGTNAYIELSRFIFQQMVQAIYTMHCQGVAHLDISHENFVLHFDQNGQLLVKLIDFGRATSVPLKKTPPQTYEYEYEKYDFTVSTYPGKCKYMSPESALFLLYKDADPYDASEEDVYALGVALYVLLTCARPFDTPFYIEEDEKEYELGYLNGNKKYEIDLQTMTYVKTGEEVNVDDIDPMLHSLQKQGVTSFLHENCLLDYVSNDALDLLNQIFTKRLSLKQLIRHPFVKTPPNPQLLMAMVQHLVEYKGMEYAEQQEGIQATAQQINEIYQNRIKIQAQYMAKQMQGASNQNPNPNPNNNNNNNTISNPFADVKMAQPQQPQQPTQLENKNAIGLTPCASVQLQTDPSSSIAEFFPESLLSPSPPPQANYIYSPSPELAFLESSDTSLSFCNESSHLRSNSSISRIINPHFHM